MNLHKYFEIKRIYKFYIAKVSSSYIIFLLFKLDALYM